MAVSIVGCRLDYSNSILYDISQANIYKLQRVQTILARIVVGAPWTSSSLNICRDLHWLPVGRRKKGKVFPYSLPSVGPGADPGVQAVSPQVT